MTSCTAPLKDRLIAHYESKIKVYQNNLLSGQPKTEMRAELNNRIASAEATLATLRARTF